MTIEEQTRLGALLKWENDKNYCRETIKISKGQNLKMGTIITLDDTTNEGKSLTISSTSETDEESSEKSPTPYGILLADVDASAGLQNALVVARSAIIDQQYVVFPEGVTDDQKKTITKQLEVRGIILRQGA